MSIFSTSTSGMQANTQWLTTIAQNVANANTTGYKTVDTAFSAMVGNSEGSPQFSGVSTAPVALNSLQGQLQQTTSTTNLAVQGNGYFIVENSSGNIFLTRDGSFVPDASGNLVNTSGYYLLGSQSNSTGIPLNSLSGLTKINVDNKGLSSAPTTSGALVTNLPASAAAVTGATPSSNAANSQYTAKTSIVAYDNLGAATTINLYFTKTASGTWEVDAYNAADAAASGGFPYSSGPLATSTVSFNPQSGTLTSGSPFSFNVPNGQSVSLDLSQTTQLAANFDVTSANLDGRAPATAEKVSIGPDGTLSFIYGNGITAPAYEIPLAKVASPNNLTSVYGGAFQANFASGAPQVGTAGSGGLGTINSASLENSTVDLATELTNMVTAQSSYEANSKVFQTAAKILDVLNNIQP